MQHIDWEDETIEGYFFQEEKWIKKKVPLPNVIYDRLPNRKAENYKPIVRAKRKLEHDYAIPWFNPGFFNKWEVHQLLMKDESIMPLLPSTETFQHFEQVERFLGTYKSIYMKPIHGSFGRNIHQLFYSQTENCYYCRYRENEENKLRKYQSLETLLNHVLKGHDLKNLSSNKVFPYFASMGNLLIFAFIQIKIISANGWSVQSWQKLLAKVA